MREQPEHPFPVVGVGASAGGLAPISQLLAALPPHPDLAFVVVQHLDPHAESHLTTLLQRHTSMGVVDVAHGMKVTANHVYVIQPNTDVAITDGVFSVTARRSERRPHFPIDHFLRSLAAVQGPRAIGVILSGTGSDGTLGICEIKAAGGLTFAQDQASAQHPGMPQSAVASGAVDLVLSPDEIAARIASLREHPILIGEVPVEHSVEDGAFHRVITALRNTSGVDFGQYRDTTIKRRTARRMLLRGFTSPTEYAQFLERDRAEADALYRDVLINVTSFFRDPEMFAALKQRVFPAILAEKADDQPIRVWVPGCSTGQEAYSVAMVLVEYLGENSSRRPIQIFGTDLGDPAALDRARTGLYPEGIEAEVTPERLRRFFTKEDRHYRIQKQIRELCVFARQNITADPPFSHVDLVTCRNVLIYMSPVLQERLLPVFHFALNRAGFLVLGMAETVGRFGELFEAVDIAHKIYRRKDASHRPPLTFMSDAWLANSGVRPAAGETRRSVDFQREADRVILARYAPPSVLVNAEFEIEQFRGRTGPFLEPPAGPPTMNLLRMVKKSLVTELRSALAEATAARAPVVRERLHVLDDDRDVEFTLRIVPTTAAQSDDFRLLVLFEHEKTAASTADAKPPERADSTDRDVVWLQQELASTKQYLQAILDDQDAAVQELRGAHEEVLSSNEELQSTNEELETTKEELQSANEELSTVNEQFQRRNHDLDVLTDDLSNFIASADLPMVTVGRDLGVRRLTPAAQRVFNLLPTDVGRSIEHIKFSLAVDRIGDIIHGVISAIQPWEQEVTDRHGRWWLLRVRPFLTGDNRVDGATLVAIDIDLVRRSHEMIEARDHAVAVVQTVREPLVVLDADCRVGLANEAFYQLFGESAASTEGRLLWDTAASVWNDPTLRQSLADACRGIGSVENVEIRRILRTRGERTLVLNARPIARRGRPTLLLLAVEDVTEIRQAEALRIDAETLRLVDRRKDEFLGILAHELRNPLAPIRFALDVLQRTDSEGSSRARQVLDRQVSHLVRIVDDLLDVSRITQGKVELCLEPTSFDEIARAAVELSRPAIDALGHVLTVSLPNEPVVLRADRVRLSQILVNLLNNAAKFTPHGGHIWLIAETVGEGHERPDWLRIRVRDTGIGISKEHIPKVFEMFMQGDRSLERSRGGLGVGLTLVRSLVSLHGGSIEVRSEGEGRGSEFIVSLPISADEESPQRDVATARQRPRRALRILVADDNRDGRELLEYLLTSDGHQVAAADNGTDALAAFQVTRPDVVILDIGMPGMNGYAVAERIRAQADTGPRPLLIALSGLGQAEDKARALAAGFDYHLTKPVNVDALTTALETAIQNRPDKG